MTNTLKAEAGAERFVGESRARIDGRSVLGLKSLKWDFCRNACIEADGGGYAQNTQMVCRNVSHYLVDVLR